MVLLPALNHSASSKMKIDPGDSFVVCDNLPEALPHLWTCLTEHAPVRGGHPAVRSFHQYKVVLRFTESGVSCPHDAVPYGGGPPIRQRVAVKDGDTIE